jgi:hypothetical protein
MRNDLHRRLKLLEAPSDPRTVERDSSEFDRRMAILTRSVQADDRPPLSEQEQAAGRAHFRELARRLVLKFDRSGSPATQRRTSGNTARRFHP